MAIKKFYISQKKPGAQYDKTKNQYFTWGFDIWLGGRRIQERGFATARLAESAVARKRLDEKNERHGFVAKKSEPFLIELFQKKLDSMAAGQERIRAKRVFDYLLARLPKKIKVTELKTAHLQEYIEARRKDKMANSTIRRELVPVMHCLNNAYLFFASLEDYRPPRKPRLKIAKQVRTKVISADERNKILNYLLAPQLEDEKESEFVQRRQTALFFQFCFLTVSRSGEVAGIKKQDVDFESNTIRIYGVKTRFVSSNIVRVLPITETMQAILDERFEKTENDFLFTKKGRRHKFMYHWLKKACEASGIKYGKNEPDGVMFHTTRHTATTALARSNRVDTKTAGEYTGHSDETMTLYYTHANAETMQIAANVLEENFGSNGLKKLANGEFLESQSENN